MYDQIFGENNSSQSRHLALDRMKIWKIRRLNLTPATILSTLSILDVQLKDTKENRFSSDELRSMYSNAFTRFLNYMSSIMRSRHLQSMYSTARELGIESFLVDLRHLCAHGQMLPSLEISRRTADYCLNWLREFYWNRERNFIIDATVRDVHLKSSVDMETAVRYWFSIYDASSEGHSRGAKSIDDLKNERCNERMEQSALELLKIVAEQIRNNRLIFIANRAINELAQLSHQTERDRGNAYIFFDALLDCSYFMNRSADIYQRGSKDERSKFIGLHQNMFRLFAICDYVNVIFIRFIAMCEDELEEEHIRKAASFWANEIATGFINFKQFKHFYKTKKEKVSSMRSITMNLIHMCKYSIRLFYLQNSKFDIDMAPINTDIMTDDIKQIYKQLGVNYNGTLIFGDTARRPWSLHFDREFLMDRAMNINQFTVDVVKK